MPRKLGPALIVIGILIMLMGVGDTLPLFAMVGVGDVVIQDISETSATLIGVGAIILLAGVGVHLKDK